MNERGLEIAVGAFVAAGLLALLVLALRVSHLADFGTRDGYALYAHFDNIGGLRPRAAVTMAGVRIGRVADIRVDPARFDAVVELRIDAGYDRLPRDTSASVLTAGLLGEQYVGLDAGGADEVLKPGDEIRLTQSALVLERVIGQFLFNKAAEGSERH